MSVRRFLVGQLEGLRHRLTAGGGIKLNENLLDAARVESLTNFRDAGRRAMNASAAIQAKGGTCLGLVLGELVHKLSQLAY